MWGFVTMAPGNQNRWEHLLEDPEEGELRKELLCQTHPSVPLCSQFLQSIVWTHYPIYSPPILCCHCFNLVFTPFPPTIEFPVVRISNDNVFACIFSSVCAISPSPPSLVVLISHWHVPISCPSPDLQTSTPALALMPPSWIWNVSSEWTLPSKPCIHQTHPFWCSGETLRHHPCSRHSLSPQVNLNFNYIQKLNLTLHLTSLAQPLSPLAFCVLPILCLAAVDMLVYSAKGSNESWLQRMFNHMSGFLNGFLVLAFAASFH